MKLIIGGFAQGKRTYVMEQYGYTEQNFFDAAEQTLAAWHGEPVINHAASLVTQWLQEGQNLQTAAEQLCIQLKDGILITQEVGCGLIPITAEERQWREAVGRVNCIFAAHADTVVRVCCGLGMVIKGA